MAKYTSIYTGEELDIAVGHAKDDSYFQRKLTAGLGISLSGQTISVLIKNICTTNEGSQTPSASESLLGTGTLNLHKIAKTGNYNDLYNLPSFAEVATSGDYTDLINKPYIGNGLLTIQKNGTTLATFYANGGDNRTVNFILSTVAETGDYNDLLNQPTISSYFKITDVVLG